MKDEYTLANATLYYNEAKRLQNTRKLWLLRSWVTKGVRGADMNNELKRL